MDGQIRWRYRLLVGDKDVQAQNQTCQVQDSCAAVDGYLDGCCCVRRYEIGVKNKNPLKISGFCLWDVLDSNQ